MKQSIIIFFILSIISLNANDGDKKSIVELEELLIKINELKIKLRNKQEEITSRDIVTHVQNQKTIKELKQEIDTKEKRAAELKKRHPKTTCTPTPLRVRSTRVEIVSDPEGEAIQLKKHQEAEKLYKLYTKLKKQYEACFATIDEAVKKKLTQQQDEAMSKIDNELTRIQWLYGTTIGLTAASSLKKDELNNRFSQMKQAIEEAFARSDGSSASAAQELTEKFITELSRYQQPDFLTLPSTPLPVPIKEKEAPDKPTPTEQTSVIQPASPINPEERRPSSAATKGTLTRGAAIIAGIATLFFYRHQRTTVAKMRKLSGDKNIIKTMAANPNGVYSDELKTLYDRYITAQSRALAAGIITGTATALTIPLIIQARQQQKAT